MQNGQPNDNTYLFDAESATELARLVNQSEIITRSMGALLPPDLDLPMMGTVLDIGCGPGSWVLEVAQRGAGHVVGIDVSLRMIDYANALATSQRISNADFRIADALRPLEFADNTFDLVNGRFISSFIQSTSWLPLISECLRVLKPGGTLVFTEGDLAITNSQALEVLSGWIGQAMKMSQHGFSPTGRSLGIVSMLGYFLKNAGFESIHQYSYIMDASYGAPHHASFVEDTHVIFTMLKPLLLGPLSVSEDRLLQIEEQLFMEMHQEDFRSLSFIVSAWGIKPTS